MPNVLLLKIGWDFAQFQYHPLIKFKDSKKDQKPTKTKLIIEQLLGIGELDKLTCQFIMQQPWKANNIVFGLEFLLPDKAK